MTWAARADALIAQIHADIPDTASLKERRAALREKAHWFHGGTSWGRKVWSARSGAYLAKHGAKSRKSAKSKQSPELFGDDIVFPFRGQ